MINLSLDELKLLAKSRNIGDYENKSKKYLIKVVSKPKPKIGSSKKKLEEIRKDFSELRHKFSKKEIDKYRKSFYDIKNCRYLSASEIEEARENLNELEKSLKFKKFQGNVDSVDYDNLGNYDDNYDFANDYVYRKIASVRRLFKMFDRDYYRPIRTDDGFGGRRYNYIDYIEYKSRGDRYENLSPEEYLDMIRPYLRDLINNHKSQEELNNEANDSGTERGEWKVQPAMQNNCISTKDFKEIHTIYSASKPVETLMGSDTDDATDRFFDTTLQRFHQSIETSNDRGSESTHEIVVLLHQYFQKIDIRRAESCIKFSIG